MSIIYDALQKTQKNREYLKLQGALIAPKIASKPWPLKPLLWFSLIILASGGVGALVSYSLKNWQWSVTKPSHTEQAEVKSVGQQAVSAAPATPGPEGQHLWMTANDPRQAMPASPSSVNPMTLNGVMISGADKLALINNQPFHVGDIVEGMRIVTIDFNSVKLQNNQEIIELRVSA